MTDQPIKPDFSNSAMVAFYLPADVADRLRIWPADGWELTPPGELHLTLAFLGEAAGLDQVAVQQALNDFAQSHEAIACEISGLGMFTPEGGDAPRPFYASVDSPALPDFQHELVEALRAAGIDLPSTHGFTPHITLAYVAPGIAFDPAIYTNLPGPIPFTLDRIWLKLGSEGTEFMLGQPASPTSESVSTETVQPVAKSLPAEMMVALGGGVKALGIEEQGGKRVGKIGGYLVLFGDEAHKDLVGDFFTPETYFGPGDGDNRDVMVHHGMQIKTGNPAADAELAPLAKKLLPPMRTKKDALGLWAETVLDLSDEYQAYVYSLSEKGAWKWSSGTAQHMIVKESSGKICQWPIIEGTLTPTPAESRMLEHRVLPLKALLDNSVSTTPDSQRSGKGVQMAAPAARVPAAPIKKVCKRRGVKSMNIMDAIKQLVPGLSEEQYAALAAVLGLAGIDTSATPAAPEAGMEGMSAPDAVTAPTEEPVRSVDIQKLAEHLKGLGFVAQQPERKPAAVRPVYAQQPDAAGRKSFPHILKLGDQDEGKKAILADVIGKDYQETIYRQNLAFAKYLKGGERYLNVDEYRALKTMYLPLDAIVQMAQEMDTTAIKTTMVEAQGDLGGFAVPPNHQAEISARLPGLTAVRAAGARVVQLTNSNSIEIDVYDGGDDRYVGNLRGQWGNETAAPGEQNAKLKQVMIPAHVYTYKVSKSQSLVEDAANLVSIVMTDITDTLAIDEDAAFLTGDGVGKPLGILPAGANGLSLTEVKTGHATLMQGDGIKALKRGVASQYRARGVWVANSDTYSAIEQIKGADGQYLFPDLSDDDMLLARRAYESEAMSDVAGNAFPLLFGDMSGYTIVERLGMSIQRFQDSNTGPNKVEYHVRRRIGGRVEQPWKFAAQKVTA